MKANTSTSHPDTSPQQQAAINELDALIALWAQFQEKRDQEFGQDSYGGVVRATPRHIWDSEVESSRMIMLVKSAIARWAGRGSVYDIRLNEILVQPGLKEGQHVYLAVGVLSALQDDIRAHGLSGLAELVRAEVFANYMDMADHLLEHGYHIASTVLGGSTLEAHIRALCSANRIPLEKVDRDGKARPVKLSELNEALRQAGIYGLPEKKNVDAWYAIRTTAAHQDKIENLSSQMVADMLSGVRRFINEHPA